MYQMQPRLMDSTIEIFKRLLTSYHNTFPNLRATLDESDENGDGMVSVVLRQFSIR